MPMEGFSGNNIGFRNGRPCRGVPDKTSDNHNNQTATQAPGGDSLKRRFCAVNSFTISFSWCLISQRSFYLIVPLVDFVPYIILFKLPSKTSNNIAGSERFIIFKN